MITKESHIKNVDNSPSTAVTEGTEYKFFKSFMKDNVGVSIKNLFKTQNK